MLFRSYDYRHAESILNANHRLKKEIESILLALELEPPSAHCKGDPYGPHRQIQRAFLRRRWAGEVIVSPRSNYRHRFDIYKERIAIEIELSSRERLYRDYFRFLMAEMDGRIDVGVIILLDADTHCLLHNGNKNGAPLLEDVIDDLNTMRSTITVPIWVIALG